jgi:hemerythrin HHE cation binding domain-containing protein
MHAVLRAYSSQTTSRKASDAKHVYGLPFRGNLGRRKEAPMATEDAPGDVIDEVIKDHKEIKQQFGEVESATGDQRKEAFEALVRMLAVHETAEQEVVHPLTSTAGADDVRQTRLGEEKEAESER